jgi:hypothetical protein
MSCPIELWLDIGWAEDMATLIVIYAFHSDIVEFLEGWPLGLGSPTLCKT